MEATAENEAIKGGEFLIRETEAQEILKEYRKRIGASEEMLPFFNEKVEVLFKRKFEDLAVEKNIGKLKNADLLFIHDEDDREVPFSSIEVVKREFPAAQIMVTKGNGHTRILKDQSVITKVLEFLRMSRLAIV